MWIIRNQGSLTSVSVHALSWKLINVNPFEALEQGVIHVQSTRTI